MASILIRLIPPHNPPSILDPSERHACIAPVNIDLIAQREKERERGWGRDEDHPSLVCTSKVLDSELCHDRVSNPRITPPLFPPRHGFRGTVFLPWSDWKRTREQSARRGLIHFQFPTCCVNSRPDQASSTCQGFTGQG